MKSKTPKHYYETIYQSFSIRKCKNGEVYIFGTFPTEEEAKERVDFLIKNDWDLKYAAKPRIRELYPDDEELVDIVCSERQIQRKTKEGYYNAVRCFEKCFNDSLSNKITNCYVPEEETVVWKKRTLKKDLMTYRNYLKQKYCYSTCKIYSTRLLTLLKHLELEIHYLPPINRKNFKDYDPVTHSDLLTKDEIKKSLSIADSLMRSVILFEVSSGCARRETLNLTIKDYLTANNVSNINDIDEDFIPTFKIRRQKTNKHYFTFCTPEANKSIKEYLLTREEINDKNPLFDMSLYYWNKAFSVINDALGLGKVRKYNKFRSHMLRKYNASTLYNNGMSIEDVDSLQGRGKDSTHSSYFMEDPELLKQKYLKYVPVLTIGEW